MSRLVSTSPKLESIFYYYLLSFSPGKNGWHEDIHVCNDCANAATHLGREAMSGIGIDVSYPSSIVCIDELAAVVIGYAHSAHSIKNDVVETTMPRLKQRIIDESFCGSAKQAIEVDL